MRTNRLLSSLLTIVIGIMFIILKSEVISIAMTVIGVSLILAGIIDLTKKKTTNAIIELIFGLMVIIFGWTLLNAALIILAVLILIYGIFQLFEVSKRKRKSFIHYLEPILSIVVAICLLFNKGGTINIIFTISGVILIIEGILSLVDYFRRR